MTSAWRLVKEHHAATALDGLGAARYGGRWNSPGRRVAYLGGTPAIAALEILAHNARADLLRSSFVLIEVRVPGELVLDLDLAALPLGWDDPMDRRAAAAIGDRWLEAGDSLALRVPSAVLPLERNVLLSPTHPDFRRLEILEPVRFRFDTRLLIEGSA